VALVQTAQTAHGLLKRSVIKAGEDHFVILQQQYQGGECVVTKPKESIHFANITVQISQYKSPMKLPLDGRYIAIKGRINLIISSFYDGHLYQLQVDK
jgi:hypothetical protein